MMGDGNEASGFVPQPDLPGFSLWARYVIKMTSKSEKKQKAALAKEIITRAINDRNKIVNKAKSYDFLNAVFCIYSYNNRSKSPSENVPDISPYDVFNRFDKKEYSRAVEKCNKLIDSGIKHGDLALTATRHRNE